MKSIIKKLFAVALTIMVLVSAAGCGSAITDVISGRSNEAEAEELPFDVAEDPSDMCVSQIGRYSEDMYCGLAYLKANPVRNMLKIEYISEGFNGLYSKSPKDAYIIVALNNHIYDADRIDELLEQNGQKKLTD